MVGFPFMLLFMILLFSHSLSGFMIGIGAIVLLSLLARLILPAIFGAGMMGSWWMSNQQTYQQPQQPPYQQTYQPYEESYQPYEQGYQPPAATYREQEVEQQYQPPSYEQTHYEEQPQAQYPQEMPPMHQ
jgi:hypothetical protein